MNKLRKLVDQILASYYLLQLKKDQWKDRSQLKNVQFKRLRAIIKHAYDYIPYYHRLFSSAKIKPEDIRSYEDIGKIPLTSKQDVQKNYLYMVPRGIDVSKLSSRFTSGSTGIPLKIVEDYSLMRSSYGTALNLYPFFECGVKPNDKFVLINARPQSIVWPRKYVILLGSVPVISIPLFSHEKLVKILRCLDPDVIWTFPPVLSSLANYDVSGINPRMVITQGGMVTQDFRDFIKKVFGSEVYETYGSVEFGHMAFECNQHCGLHIITNGVYIEFVDEHGEHVSPGEQGEIIVTGLHNYTMPLIRYRIGDLGIPSNEKCSCRRSLPLIKSIQGRVYEQIILPSGRKISSPHIYPFIYNELKENVFSISQYQIIQEQKNRIVFKIVKGKNFDPQILERIKNNLETYFNSLGENLQVFMQIVEEIPIERTGKRRIIISNVS